MIVPDSLNAPLMENANYLGRGNAGNYFQGYLDDFRVYMKTLASSDIIGHLHHSGPLPDNHNPGHDRSDTQCGHVACDSCRDQRQRDNDERDCGNRR